MRNFESSTLRRCGGSPTVQLTTRGLELRRQGRDILMCSGGEPDFNTPEAIKQAGIRAIMENHTHYTPAAGIAALRSRIAQKLREENGIHADPDAGVLITPGGKQALFQALFGFLGQGDEALLPEPAWVSYREIIRMTGASCVPVPLSADNNYRITRALLEAQCTPHTKLLVLCNPCNPTGRVLTPEELEEVADFIEAHDLLLVADEIYERLVYDGRKHHSIGALPRVHERVITLNGFSKAYAMTGWRLGYAAAHPDLIRVMRKIQENTVTTASSIAQQAALAAFDCEADVQRMVKSYRNRRDTLVQALREIPGFSCPLPEGAFYAFPQINFQGKRSHELCAYILENADVLAAPGEAFGAGGENCIRIAYSVPMRDLEEIVSRLRRIF